MNFPVKNVRLLAVVMVLACISAAGSRADNTSGRVAPSQSQFQNASTVWSSMGVAVCADPGNQSNPVALRDGTAGTFVVWADMRSDVGDIYGSYLNPDGSIRTGWASNGNRICVAPNSQNLPKLAGSGDGTAIVAWVDARSDAADIYAQKIDRDGNRLWDTTGVAVCVQADVQNEVDIAADGSDGAWLVWQDKRNSATNGGKYDVYGIHLMADGTADGLGSGILICNAPDDQTGPRVVAGSDHPFFFWNDADNALYGHRFIGAQLAGLTSVVDTTRGLLDGITPGDNVEAVEDGLGGAFASWYDTGDQTYRCTRVNGFGGIVSGWDLAPRVGPQPTLGIGASMAPDLSGGVLLSWQQGVSIAVQRLDPAGNVSSGWAPDGVLFSAANLISARVTYDGVGGAFACWVDEGTTGTRPLLHAGRVEADGMIHSPWPVSGIRVTPSSGIDQQDPFIVADAAGGAIVVWSNEVSSGGPFDIYAQHIDASATVAEVPAEQDGQPSALRLRPNPCSLHGAAIELGLERGSTLSVNILDLSGRSVRTVCRSVYFAAGIHSVSWDGADDSGRACRPGVYWVHADGVSIHLARKLVFLR